MYFRRKIDKVLQEWKAEAEHKPLIIKGARQIGKSTSILEFAKKNYESVVEINFILEPRYKRIVSDGYDVNSIIRNLTLINPDVKLIEHNTLIFFDEIQDFPDITTSLKSFAQDGRYDVICSGSLLGVCYKLVQSISVGYKTERTMHPMDFEEFIWALGYDESIGDSMLEHMIQHKAFSDLEMDKYSSLFFDYCMTGGCPGVVSQYAESRNFAGINQLKKDLLADYRQDVIKYHDSIEASRILAVFDSIPVFLSRDNKKFMPSKLKGRGTLEEYVPPLQWLSDAGLVLQCHALNVPSIPLTGNWDKDRYKLYLFDTGLLLTMLDEEAEEDFRINKNFGIYNGALWESIIASELAKQDKQLFYYEKQNSTLEEDFILRSRNHVVPIKVKAKNNKSKSLSTLISSPSYPDIEYGIKLIAGNIGYANNIHTFPRFTGFLLSRYLKTLE